MSELHAFFDRDVFFKLICCDLWEAALEAYSITHPYRLASAGPRGLSQQLKKLAVSPKAKAAIELRCAEIAAAVPVLPEAAAIEATSSSVFNDLNSVPSIDGGEALLVAVALSFPEENRLVTGDKRFVNALSERRPDTFIQLRPQLLTFEECLMSMCDHLGFDFVRDRALPVRTCDGTLRIALGSGDLTAEAAFRDALAGFAAPLAHAAAPTL